MMQTAWWAPVDKREAPAPTIVDQGVPDARLPFRALLTFTFILLIAPQKYLPFLGPLRIAMLAAVVAAVAHGWISWRAQRVPVRMEPPMVYLGLLVVWSVLTIPFSLWPTGSLSYLIEHYLKTIIVFVLLANVIDTQPKLRTICWAMVIMAVPISVTTVRHYLSGAATGEVDRVIGYAASLTENPNDTALMLNLILPIAIALFLDATRLGIRLLLAGMIGVLVLAVIATFSRGGFLTLGYIFLAYLWRLRSRRERALIPVVLVAMVCALPLVPAEYYERLGTIVEVEEDESNSAQTRLSDMKVALGLAVANPIIGAGIGQNALAMNEARGETWTEVHDVYLQIAVELGIPGLLLYLLLLRSCLHATATMTYRERSGDKPDFMFNIGEGLQVSLRAFALAAIFHPVAYHFYFYYFAGMAVAGQAIYRRRHASLPSGAEAASEGSTGVRGGMVRG